jgi:hypothetical protein
MKQIGSERMLFPMVDTPLGEKLMASAPKATLPIINQARIVQQQFLSTHSANHFTRRPRLV